MPKKSLAPPTANIQPKDPAALLTVWMMVTTHPWWLDSDTTITVPYAAIDKVLDLDAGTTESIWNLARKNKAFMKKTGALFEKSFLGEQPLNPPWSGPLCNFVGAYIKVYHARMNVESFPTIKYKEPATTTKTKIKTKGK
jgi:hypothetical protein